MTIYRDFPAIQEGYDAAEKWHIELGRLFCLMPDNPYVSGTIAHKEWQLGFDEYVEKRKAV